MQRHQYVRRGILVRDPSGESHVTPVRCVGERVGRQGDHAGVHVKPDHPGDVLGHGELRGDRPVATAERRRGRRHIGIRDNHGELGAEVGEQ